MKRKAWFWILFAIGLGANLLGVMGPLHEFFHWIFSWLSGSPARITAWGYCMVDHPTLMGAIAGPFGEVIVLYILTFWFLSKGWPAGMLPFGAAHAEFVLEYTGTDLLEWVPYVAGDTVMAWIVVLWTVFNLVFIVLGWLGVIANMKILKT
jgi:hypothetical protein